MALTFFSVMIGSLILIKAIEWLCDYFSARAQFREEDTRYNTNYEFSLNEKDKQMMDIEADVLKELFPDGIAETLKTLNEEERIKLFEELTQKLALAYGLGSDAVEKIEFIEDLKSGNSPLCGSYNYGTRTIMLNRTYICFDLHNNRTLDQKIIDDVLVDCVDTVIHELRHAYQWQACSLFANNEDYSVHDKDNRVVDWATNFVNYVQCNENLEAYNKQPVECDARNFASAVIGEYMRRIA
ncbi:MAG: hypothetical protein IKJ68_00080 [Clostridia bacterium]|nr:hypothetical protein [Clostridia bacterium]